jgi:hypothetical protein
MPQSFLLSFLMHRVELKGFYELFPELRLTKFLMHRVELKAIQRGASYRHKRQVPNAPCGVESGLVLKTLKNKMGVGCNVF